MTDGIDRSRESLRRIGFIGLGDQGLPMATAIAEAGFELHVWARRPASVEALGDASYISHGSIAELAAAADAVALCVSTDEDVLRIAAGGLLDAMPSGSVLVNHGTGLPGNAVRLAELAAKHGVDTLDAPVSGGRPAAVERRLTTLVGGEDAVAYRCRPVFEAFSSHVVHSGTTGNGQMAKLFNNALLMVNQAGIADFLELAAQAGMDPVALVDGLRLGSAPSAALTLLNSMITTETVEHLSSVEALDMELFEQAMREAGVSAEATTKRGLSGAHRLPAVVAELNP